MRPCIRLSAVLVVLAFAGCPLDEDTKTTLNGLCIPADTELVLVVESSARMMLPANSLKQQIPTKWELALDAGKKASQAVKPIDRAILSFPADQAVACTGKDCGWQWVNWYDDQSTFVSSDWYWKGGRKVLKECDVGDPDIGFGEVPGQYVSGLEHVNIGGKAPIADALLSAFNALVQRNPSGTARHIFLLADGADTCGGDAARMVKKIRQAGVDVWVLGFLTSDVAALNELAELGGHPQPGERKYFVVDSGDDVANAILMAFTGTGTEICDGVDNDCDGHIDESLTRDCPLPCGGGVQSCQAGAWSACELPGSTAGWMAEHCDGKDDDCDGDIDEDFALGGACVNSIGTCSNAGTFVCAGDGSAAVCDAPFPIVAAETCNSVDDDCDGQIDESVRTACTTPCGYGYQFCEAGVPTDCVVSVFNIEKCNGVDDDCDGQVDESYAVATACKRGQGACETHGYVVCSEEGLESFCDAPEPQTGVEVCNGLDDDCDGVIDNGDLCPKGQICFQGQCVYD